MSFYNNRLISQHHINSKPLLASVYNLSLCMQLMNFQGYSSTPQLVEPLNCQQLAGVPTCTSRIAFDHDIRGSEANSVHV